MQREIQVFTAGDNSAVALGAAGQHLTELVNQGWEIVSTHGTVDYLCAILQREAAERPLDASPTDLSDAD